MVNHALSPYTANPIEKKFYVDSTAGPVQITLPALGLQELVVVKDAFGTSASGGTITVLPNAGNIENPSNPGSLGAVAEISQQGGCVIWQQFAHNTLIVIAGP